MDTYNQQNLVDEINLTRSLLDSLERQITAADKAYQDMSTTLAVIKERGSIAASETRISIGSGMFLKGNLDVSGNIIIPIGSDIYIEATTEEAVKRIETNLDNLRKSLEGLLDRQAELRIRHDDLLAIAQNLGNQEQK